ncbi:MAG: hypothetical protein Ct9H90mP20_1390 [Candidatus Neomarinimicrobiota bacterium]|nr:MAG: hypothetical protein Ct9H90mP20_1390 [Candidatus Neomarinimicrobiota bacterium]
MTGIFQLSLNKYDDTMVFSGYSSRGWDVYRMNNPLDLEKVDIQPTNYYKNKDIDKEEELVDLRKDKWRGRNLINQIILDISLLWSTKPTITKMSNLKMCKLQNPLYLKQKMAIISPAI